MNLPNVFLSLFLFYGLIVTALVFFETVHTVVFNHGFPPQPSWRALSEWSVVALPVAIGIVLARLITWRWIANPNVPQITGWTLAIAFSGVVGMTGIWVGSRLARRGERE